MINLGCVPFDVCNVEIISSLLFHQFMLKDKFILASIASVK